MENQTEKLCENCYYFCQHYYKTTQGKLAKAIGDGHCTSGEIAKHVSRKIIQKHGFCEFWKPNETLHEEQKESIFRVLNKMSERLEDIAFILKND